jgi:uncharacterized membrane protein
VPYCTQCGQSVVETDAYCRHCGSRQPVRTAAEAGQGLSPRAASILCYIPWLGWIAALYVLASGKFHHEGETRFHAYQGLYIFVAWLIVDWAVEPWLKLMPGPHVPLDKLLHLGLLVVWIIMLVNTSQGRKYSLPVLGELAERSL